MEENMLNEVRTMAQRAWRVGQTPIARVFMSFATVKRFKKLVAKAGYEFDANE